MANHLKSDNKSTIAKTAGKFQFVDNAELHAELAERKLKVLEAIDQGKEPPQISESIGKKLLLISSALSFTPRFSNYTYREDMVMTGVCDCVRYIDNFDTERGTSAFAYFTQICWYAFLRVIKPERKQSYIKHEVIKSMCTVLDDMQLQDQDMDTEFKNYVVEMLSMTDRPGLEKTFSVKPCEVEEEDLEESFKGYL